MGSDRDIFEQGLSILPPTLRQKALEAAESTSLPVCPDHTRGVPNFCLRSALFGVIKRGRRKEVKKEQIASVKGVEIRFSGWRLDQGDFDVLVQALHLAARGDGSLPGNWLRFSVKGFLKGIGRHTGKSGREWLQDSLRRLSGTVLEIRALVRQDPAGSVRTYFGPLIDEFYHCEAARSYYLEINPGITALFDAGWTQLQWQQRLLLNAELAKWLHGFYSSHKKPFPVKVKTLRELCGSECRRLVDFRRQLRGAMDELFTGGVLASWKIDEDDKMHVQRSSLCLSLADQKEGGITVTSKGHGTHI